VINVDVTDLHKRSEVTTGDQFTGPTSDIVQRSLFTRLSDLCVVYVMFIIYAIKRFSDYNCDHIME
jgi:hypothetical protein